MILRSIFTLLLIFTLATTTAAKAQDLPIDLDIRISTDGLHDVEFVNDMVGWAYSYGTGKIYKTTNGGKYWTISAILAEGYYEQMTFLDENDGVIVGGNKGVYRTDDGGNTWTDIAPNSWTADDRAFIYGMFYDAEMLYISALVMNADNTRRAAIHYRSYDKGKTWEAITDSRTGMLLYLNRERDNLISGSNGLMSSADDGKSWQRLLSPPSGTRWPIRAYDKEGARAIAGSFSPGVILSSDDNWQTHTEYSLTSNRIRDIKIDGNVVLAVGDSDKELGNIHLSLDGGNSWKTLETEFDDIHRMAETENYIFMVGKNGRVIRLNKNKWGLKAP